MKKQFYMIPKYFSKPDREELDRIYSKEFIDRMEEYLFHRSKRGDIVNLVFKYGAKNKIGVGKGK